MTGSLPMPLITRGGLDMRDTRPSGLLKMQPLISRALWKSREKHDSVENRAPDKMAPKISVAPKDASVKSQPVKFVS